MATNQPNQDPDGPEYPRPESGSGHNLAPNVLGAKALVYGACAAIVLGCLLLIILVVAK